MNTFTNLKTILLSSMLLVLFTSVSFAQNCTLSVDFEETAWEGKAYAERTVTDQWGEWNVSGVVVTTDENDRHNSGAKSIRLRGNTGDNCHFQMNFDKLNGIGTVSFYYASYSTHKDGAIVLYYSTDGGSNWNNGGSVAPPAWSGAMLEANFALNIPGNARIKIVREGGLKTGTSVNIDDLCLTDYNPSGYVVSPTFDPPSGSYSGPIDVKITTTTTGASIRYTLDGNDPTESSTLYTEPVHISSATTIKAKGWKEGIEPSPVSTANYVFPEAITTLAALRALAPAYNGGQNAGETVYKFTGQAVITQKSIGGANDNLKYFYIQDETAAIMIFDPSGKISMLVGDKITNVSGTLTNYFGMLEIVPSEDCSFVGDNQHIAATVINASDLNYDHNSPIQAKIVTLKGATYAQTGVFEAEKYYNLTGGLDSVIFTENKKADYLNTSIPTVQVDITGVCNFKGGKDITTRNRIVPLDKSNKVPLLSITDLNKSTIKLSPNPADNFVNIVTNSTMKLEVYSLLGNLITTESLSEGNNTISVSQYPAGMYLMKLTDRSTGQSYIQKLVVK